MIFKPTSTKKSITMTSTRDTQIVVVDTSAFTNPDAARHLGVNGHMALRNFLQAVADRQPLDTLVYMTPSVWDELSRSQLNVTKLPRYLLGHLHIKSPNRHALSIPGHVLWQLVDEWRKRSDEALKFAVGLMKESLELPPKRDRDAQDDEEMVRAPKRVKTDPTPSANGIAMRIVDGLPPVATTPLTPQAKREPRGKRQSRRTTFTPNPLMQKYVQRLRAGVRHHLRENVVDSAADLDVLLLAKELGAKVLTSDKGLLAWADKMGLAVLPVDMAKAWIQRK